jgi:hypothetical protein
MHLIASQSPQGPSGPSGPSEHGVFPELRSGKSCPGSRCETTENTEM